MTLRFYGDIQRVNTEERIVSGYAATTQEASDGLTIVRDAYASALTEYMRFANIREMHRPSAVGVAREAEVDDTGLWIDAFIQDADAWDKVKTGVYKAFSIGAKITERDAEDETLIRGIRIVEISSGRPPCRSRCGHRGVPRRRCGRGETRSCRDCGRG
jgi:phage head maturation protease